MLNFLCMMQFLCVDPLIVDSSHFSEAIESAGLKQENDYSELEKKVFQQALEIERWQIWIQNGPAQEHFCIQAIECQNPLTFFMAFKHQVEDQNRYALWLHHLFQTFFGAEYSFFQPTLKIEQVLHLPIDQHMSKEYDFCYMLPLLSHKIDDHKEYCRAAMNEKREPTIKACQAFGMIEMTKWIQQSNDRNYVLYYQKMRQPIETSRQAFLALKDQPKALQATQTLREQTGLTFEELSPEIRCLSLFDKVQ